MVIGDVDRDSAAHYHHLANFRIRQWARRPLWDAARPRVDDEPMGL